MIYKRFTEKSAEEWRQIYKALQLLEFLIKNGSERVIDDARSHMSLLKMLRQFHYIDQNGKDQGINVRNRSKELTDLLSDVDRIRAERKKSRTTRNKYGGTEGGVAISSMSTGRFNGFGNDAGGAVGGGYGGYSGGVYGDGGGFGGQQSSDDYGSTQNRRDRFEEYDEYDEGSAGAAPPRRNPPNRTTPAAPPKEEAPKAKQPEVDLFEFGDDDVVPSAPATNLASEAKAPASILAFDDFGTMQSGGGDDEFDDFQQATVTSTAPPTTSASVLAPTKPTMNNGNLPSPYNSNSATSVPLMSPPPSSSTPTAQSTSTANYSAFKSSAPASTISPTPIQSPPLQPSNQPKPTGFQPQGPNYFGSIATTTSPGAGMSTPSTNVGTANSGLGPVNKPLAAQGVQKTTPATDPFASLGVSGSKTRQTQKGPTMADMAKQKADQALWGTTTQRHGNGGASGGDLI